MDKYYYLASQLPFLRFADRTHLDSKSFLKEAEKWLCVGDFSILSGVNLNDFSLKPQDPTVLKAYKEFELGLRESFSLWRKSRKEGSEERVSAFPLSLVKEGTPLEAETRLLHWRWKFIEEKEEGHYFDLTFLIIYLLKLQILERLFTFDKEKGRKKFEELCKVSYA
ncbi:MAG: DUF2764 family protein [Candidatus Omnitrophica bacterium]|nr:DUF2764 family protein [Candidatus Omnitrophota bacterium]